MTRVKKTEEVDQVDQPTVDDQLLIADNEVEHDERVVSIRVVAQSVNPTEQYEPFTVDVRLNSANLAENEVSFTLLRRTDGIPFDLTAIQKGDLTHAVKEKLKRVATGEYDNEDDDFDDADAYGYDDSGEDKTTDPDHDGDSTEENTNAGS